MSGITVSNSRNVPGHIKALRHFEVTNSSHIFTQENPCPADPPRPRGALTDAQEAHQLKLQERADRKKEHWKKEQKAAKAEALDPLSEGVKRALGKGPNGGVRDLVTARADQIYAWLIEYGEKSATGEKEIREEEIFGAGYDPSKTSREQVDAIANGITSLEVGGFGMSQIDLFNKTTRYFSDMPGFRDLYLPSCHAPSETIPSPTLLPR